MSMEAIYNEETEYILKDQIENTLKYGYQNLIVHKDSMDMSLYGLDKCAVYNISDNTQTSQFLTPNELSDIMGKLFVPVQGYISEDYFLMRWCFDERLIGGRREQDMLSQLLTYYGFQNLRDLDNDGLNDTEIHKIDYESALADTDKRYFMVVSSLEKNYVQKWNQEESLELEKE